jgi:molecular chaperone DnaK
VRKGTSLPAEGVTPVRAARDLRGGEPGQLRVELFQQTGEIDDPDLALSVGDFRLDAQRHLDPGERLRRGQVLNLRWRVEDNHLLTLAVEAPDLVRVIEARDLYLPEAGHANYDGKEGAELANALLAEAEQAVEEAAQDLGSPAETAITDLRRRLDDQHGALSASVEAETHRSAAEEARRVRQDIALLRHRPEHRARALSAELADAEGAFDRLRAKAEAVEIDRFDRLSGTARRALRTEDFEATERALSEMNSLRFGVLFRDPEFLVGLAAHLAEERYASIDKALHDRLVAQAEQAVARQDTAALRTVIGHLLENRISTGGRKEGLRELADLLGA